MTKPSENHTQPLGRQIAMAGVVLAVSLALISMTLLAVLLLPQLLPTLFAASPVSASSVSASSVSVSLPTILAGIVPMAQAAQPHLLHSVIQSARTAWISGDADAFAALFTETGEFVVPGQVYRSPAQIRAVTADFSASHADVQIEIRRMITEGSQVVVEWHWEDTETATGQRMVADDAIVVDFEGDKIKRWREYIDASDAS